MGVTRPRKTRTHLAAVLFTHSVRDLYSSPRPSSGFMGVWNCSLRVLAPLSLKLGPRQHWVLPGSRAIKVGAKFLVLPGS